MTPTPTPEERADALLDAMADQLGHACACVGPALGDDLCHCGMKRRALIASAIRQAENDAYERAAAYVADNSDGYDCWADPDTIRTLKSPTTKEA
jgi:hypothetical protein